MLGWRPNPLLLLAANMVLAGAVFAGAESLEAPANIPCVALTFQHAIFACGIVLVLDLLVLRWQGGRRFAWAPLAILVGLSAIAAWLGSYQHSPLELDRGGAGQVSVYRLTRYGFPAQITGPSQIIIVKSGSPLEIQPILPSNLETVCQWRADNGGAIDDPSSCDIAYEAPRGATYDILHLLTQSGCGLPQHSTQLRLSIAP